MDGILVIDSTLWTLILLNFLVNPVYKGKKKNKTKKKKKKNNDINCSQLFVLLLVALR